MDKVQFYWTDPDVKIHFSSIKAFGIEKATFISLLIQRWRDIYWNERETLVDGEFFIITHDEIKRNIGLSFRSQQKYLRSMIELGIVEVRKHGTSDLYKINAKAFVDACYKKRKRSLVK